MLEISNHILNHNPNISGENTVEGSLWWFGAIYLLKQWDMEVSLTVSISAGQR